MFTFTTGPPRYHQILSSGPTSSERFGLGFDQQGNHFFFAVFSLFVPCFPFLFCVHQAQALALRVEQLVWGVEAMSAGLSMGQLDTLKAVLLDQVARVDEAKVGQLVQRAAVARNAPRRGFRAK